MIEAADRRQFSDELRARRRGRPRSKTPMLATSVYLPADVYDAFCRRAMNERQNVSTLLRQALIAAAKSEPIF